MRIRKREVFFWFFFIASFVFSDFLIFGKILIGNLDVADINLPNLLAAKRNFLLGEWGLWNPYVNGGSSSFNNAILPQFYPENWLLFWLPEKIFFQAVTFVSFLKYWGIGLFAYFWFRDEVQNEKWALFAATVYQLCGFTLWTVISSDAISLQFYFTMSAAFIWSAHRRGRVGNYLFWSFGLWQIFYCSNYVYSAYLLALLVLLFCYRHRLSGHWVSFGLALVTTILIAMPRWFPHWEELKRSSRAAEPFFYEVVELPFLGLRLLIPEIFGINYWATFHTISGVSSVFQAISVQVFANFPHYFGVVSLLLMLMGVRFLKETSRHFRWFYAAIVAVLAVLLAVEPVNSVLRGLMHPFFHLQSVHFLLAPLVCLLLAHLGTRFESEESLTPSSATKPILWGTVLYFGVVWALNFQVKWDVSLAFKLFAMGAIIFFKVRKGLSTHLWLGALIAGSLLCILFLKSTNPIHLNQVRLQFATLGLLAVYAFSIPRAKWGVPIVLLALLVIVSLYWGGGNEIFVLETQEQSFFVALLGLGKFLLITALFIFMCRQKRAAFFGGCLALLLFEMLPSAKIQTRLVLNPFFLANSPYPEKLKKSPIYLSDYRVNYPNLFSLTPLYFSIYRNVEVLSAMHSVYGVRSYGGYVNSVPARYAKFLESFLPEDVRKKLSDGGKHGYIANLHNSRFLDLVGVGFDFDPKTNLWTQRPSALSRFMFFESFETLTEERALNRLQETDFNPQEQVVLESYPGFASRVPTAAKKIEYRSIGTDRLSLQLRAETHGILLFNDSFHPGWRVKINGQSQSVLRANDNFMAVALTPGLNNVEFEFLPQAFVEGVQWARWGIVVFGFSLFGLVLVPSLKLARNFLKPIGKAPVG